MLFENLESNIEELTGLSIDEIQRMDVSDFRKYIEKKNKKPLKFTSHFPFIGRGSVLHDFISDKQLDKEIDKFLKEKD